jgi:hypothetical protein
VTEGLQVAGVSVSAALSRRASAGLFVCFFLLFLYRCVSFCVRLGVHVSACLSPTLPLCQYFIVPCSPCLALFALRTACVSMLQRAPAASGGTRYLGLSQSRPAAARACASRDPCCLIVLRTHPDRTSAWPPPSLGRLCCGVLRPCSVAASLRPCFLRRRPCPILHLARAVATCRARDAPAYGATASAASWCCLPLKLALPSRTARAKTLSL